MNKNMTFVERVTLVLSKPAEFFEGIKAETGVKKSFMFYLALSLISLVLGVVSSYFLSDYYLNLLFSLIGLGGISLPISDFTTIIVSSILMLPVALAFSFLFAGIVHLWCMLFGGKASYTKSYQLYAYSRTPSLLFSWVPVINFFVVIYSLVLLIIGTEKVHGIDRKKAILMYVIPFAVSFLIVLLVAVLMFYVLSSSFRNMPIAGV